MFECPYQPQNGHQEQEASNHSYPYQNLHIGIVVGQSPSSYHQAHQEQRYTLEGENSSIMKLVKIKGLLSGIINIMIPAFMNDLATTPNSLPPCIKAIIWSNCIHCSPSLAPYPP